MLITGQDHGEQHSKIHVDFTPIGLYSKVSVCYYPSRIDFVATRSPTSQARRSRHSSLILWLPGTAYRPKDQQMASTRVHPPANATKASVLIIVLGLPQSDTILHPWPSRPFRDTESTS